MLFFFPRQARRHGIGLGRKQRRCGAGGAEEARSLTWSHWSTPGRSTTSSPPSGHGTDTTEADPHLSTAPHEPAAHAETRAARAGTRTERARPDGHINAGEVEQRHLHLSHIRRLRGK